MSQYLSMLPSQQMRLEQRLTPQLIQSMEILQLPLAALEARIRTELESNPVLEESEHVPAEDAAPKDDGGLLAAVTALSDAAKGEASSSDQGDDDAARAADALRASTSTAEESPEPAPQFVDDGGEGGEEETPAE